MSFLTIVSIVHLLLVLFLMIRLLWRDNLSPPARLAWFLVILSLPYAGVIVYFLFGEASLGRTINHRHDEAFARIRENDSSAFGSVALMTQIEVEYRAPFEFVGSLAGFLPTTGNRAELMPDAATARSRLIADIDGATDHVHVLYYIWLNDQTGTNVANALIRAAGRGVKCRAMADGLGSRAMIHSPLWKQMSDAGVEVAVALPFKHLIRTILFSRLDLRNHRKITVIDGRITYCGSQNCADPEFRVKPKFAPWVDIMVRFEGPVVAQSQLLFASDWMLHHPDASNDLFAFATGQHADGFVAQVFGDGPTERMGSTPQLFSTLMSHAKRELTISTPYFVPDQTVLDAICAAAHRGVTVTMIFPQKNDSWVVAAVSRSYYRRLIQAGVNIYEFKDGLLHAKTLTIDGAVTLIGSTNMDLRSFDLNYENDILLRDDELTLAVRERQDNYISRSDRVSIEDVDSWSSSRRIWNNVVATLGPIL
ncbi:cardiolipin synthase [Stieleria mannarensis]|uniref:cardiolipin synthase n=1 Tax=Stieleria mannarensis TaxID=2755585 RepID=UPI0016012050|nr:cardiolipin synthase [Rhodopirellula sp. JC639]